MLRNDYSGDGGWIKILLRGGPGLSNCSAIGAQAVLEYDGRVQARTVTAQSSFYSVDDLHMHFGIGSAEEADVRIRWPSGTEERVSGLAPGSSYVIEEGTGIVP